MRIIDLTPGMRICDPRGGSHTFMAQCLHPLYRGMQLVIWRLADGTWSHDALSPIQEIGEVDNKYPDLAKNLKEGFHRATKEN